MLSPEHQDYKQPWLAQIASQGCKDKEIKN